MDWTFQDPKKSNPPFTVSIPNSVDINQGEMLVEGARMGLGLCQAFRFLVYDNIQSGSLVEVLANYVTKGPPIHALCTAGNQNILRVQVMLQFLRDIFHPSSARLRNKELPA